MKEIIERLERATEGSRELDLQIARHAYSESGIGNSVLDDPTDDDSPSPLLRTRAGHTYHLYIPFYTTSLDAALTLVPEGWGWELGCVHGPNEEYVGRARPWCRIWVRDGVTPELSGTFTAVGNGDSRHLNANTPALALCIAALKARADKEG